jgi:hypothetical protein
MIEHVGLSDTFSEFCSDDAPETWTEVLYGPLQSPQRNSPMAPLIRI